ncbi:hypothetical protein ACFSM5_07405 [Lacibacterium aquatile]|uniref:Flagellar protein FlgN n=1 Tax=Lacibacterium aquatile TaxID=1168082 RepID=A0ABW5DQC8_9PROT
MQQVTGYTSAHSVPEPRSIDELGIDIVAFVEQVDLLIELTEIETQAVEAQSWEQIAEVAEAKRLLLPLIQELSGLWPEMRTRMDWLNGRPPSQLDENDQLERDGLSLLHGVLIDLDETLERNEAALWRAHSANKQTLETLVRIFSVTGDSPDLYTRNGAPPAPPSGVSIVGQTVSI